jgi:hypothetical protein
MNATQIYKQQTIERVLDFAKNHLNLFPEGSAARDLVASLGAAVREMSSHASQQVSGSGAVKTSGIGRQEARRELSHQLTSIAQTARVLKLDQFYMPRTQTDAALIAAGLSFVQQAEPVQQDFLRQGLPADFIEALNRSVAELQQFALKQTSSKGARSKAIAAFNEVLNVAMEDLKRFDVLVKNTLGDNPGVMAEWKIARRVSHPPSVKAATVPSAPALAAAG